MGFVRISPEGSMGIWLLQYIVVGVWMACDYGKGGSE